MKIHAIIVAAGSGSRFGGPLPKQFLPLDGMPVAMRAVNALRNAIPQLTDTIVLSPDEVDRWTLLCRENGFESPPVAFGGDSRFESVMNALSMVPSDTDILLVHDAARPLADAEMIRRVLEPFANPECHGAVPAIPVTDSLREITDGRSAAVDRSRFRAVQTPQAFRFPLLKDAYQKAARADISRFTDDASVMEFAGFNNLVLTDGSTDNIKITNPSDLAIAHIILKK